MAKAQQRLA